MYAFSLSPFLSLPTTDCAAQINLNSGEVCGGRGGCLRKRSRPPPPSTPGAVQVVPQQPGGGGGKRGPVANARGGGGRWGSVRRQSEVLERRASAAQLTCCPLLRLLGRKGPLRGPSTIHVLSQQGYDIQPQSSAKNLTPLLNLLSCVSCTIICIAYFFCCSMKRF